jgi:hypothetical protein
MNELLLKDMFMNVDINLCAKLWGYAKYAFIRCQLVRFYIQNIGQKVHEGPNYWGNFIDFVVILIIIILLYGMHFLY